MNGKRFGLSSASLVPFLVVAACAGTKLNDVGDVSGQGGDGGDDGKSTNGSDRPGSGGAGNGGTTAGTAMIPRGGSVGVVGGTGGRAPQEEWGGAAGEAGDAGAGGAAEIPVECATCEIVSVAPDIRAVATGSERVFWVEHGSYDGLGNYQDDGRLMSLAFAGGQATVVATGLQGPVELEVSADFAYAIVDQSSAMAGAFELVRIALDTGSVDVLQAVPEYQSGLQDGVVDWFNRYFVAKGGAAFWTRGSAIYQLAEDADGPPSKLVDTQKLYTLMGDDSLLYLYDADGFKTLPYAGGTPTLIRAEQSSPGVSAHYGLSLVGDYVYGYDWDENTYVSRMPKVGGAWKHVAQLDIPPTQLVIDGDHYFDDRSWRRHPADEASCSLREGSLSSATPSEILATSPMWRDNGLQAYWRAWDVAPTAVYFGWQDQLYRVPRTP